MNPEKAIMTLYNGPFDSVTQDEGVLILTWKPETATMQTSDFFASMVRLGKIAKDEDVHGLLIDIRQFKHQPTEDVMAYREKHVVPLYNAAGIRRMAFLFPGENPGEANQDPGGDYEVKRFTSENGALAWANE